MDDLEGGVLKHAFRGRYHTLITRIGFSGHAQRTSEGLEHRFTLVVRVFAAQVVNVQGNQRMIDETLEKLAGQVDVELTDVRARKRDVVEQAGPPGKVDHDARQCFVQWNVGVPVAAQAGLIADRGGKSL